MATEKLSVSVDSDLWRQARSLPLGASPSALVAEALRRLVQSESLRVLLDELDERHGPVPAALLAEAEAKWSRG